MALNLFGRKALPQTLAAMVARRVFSVYLLLAVAATVVQVGLEYLSTRKLVAHELRTVALAFEPGLRQALWNYQEGQVRAMAEGLLSSPLIRGVSVRDTTGLIWVETAEAQTATHPIAVTIPVVFDVLSTPQHIGEFRLISDERAVWLRMQDGLLLIVLAALLKTVGLWMVIRWVVQRLLAQPLEDFTHQLQGSRRPSDLKPIHLSNTPAQEWTVMAHAFNQLVHRLKHKDAQLRALNATLDEQVQRRTQALYERTQELAQERDHVAAILDVLPEGVMVVDARGRIARINAVARQQLPFAHDAPRSAYEGIPAPQHAVLTDGLEQVVRLGRWSGEVHLNSPNADARCLLLVAVQVAPDPNAMVVLVVVDISAQKDAEAANKAKSRFLAALGHDLRQPANALGIYLTLLQEKFGPVDRGRLIDKAVDCQAALAHVFDSLLFMARVESKRLVPEAAPVALSAMWSRLAHVYGPQAEKKQLQLVWTPTDTVVNTDGFMLERLLSNLVSNAIRYTPTGAVSVGARTRGQRVRVYVADTGVGIPGDAKPHIFEEFFQLNKGRGEHLGVGLGLSIVASLAQALGLRCRVFSRANGGTLFVLTGLLTLDVRP